MTSLMMLDCMRVPCASVCRGRVSTFRPVARGFASARVDTSCLRRYVRSGIFVRMGAETTVKKTYNLPPKLLKRVKQLLHAKTETEAIVRSLQEVAIMNDIEQAVRATGGTTPKYKALR